MSIKTYLRFLNIIILISSITNNLNLVKLDIENYENEVNLSKEIWLIEYYSEKCSTCKEFSSIWEKLVKNINYIKIGRVNIDEPNGVNLASKLNALDNGIPCIRLDFGNNKYEDIMIGTEEPFPNEKILKKRIDNILNKKGKLKDGKYFINEEL